MGAGAEAVGGGDAALEVAGARLDFVSTLEPPISAVASISSSFLPGIVLASLSLGEEEVLSSVALLESPLSPFDLPLLLSLLDLLDEAELRREPYLERDWRERELERGRDWLRDGFVEGGGDELDDSSSDTDVEVDESSLIIIPLRSTSPSCNDDKLMSFPLFSGVLGFYFIKGNEERGL